MSGHEHDFNPAGGVLAVLLLLVMAGIYLTAVRRTRRAGRDWPWWRSPLWLSGLVVTGSALTGPLAESAHTDFRAHMLGHVLLGMLGPLLLVLSAPVTLALRALPVRCARRISRVLRSWVAVCLTDPLVAAVANVGGLWVLYRTNIYSASASSPLLHLFIHVHIFVAAYLFTVSIIGPDPAPHRRGLRVRATVLVLVIAAHNILAKTVYAVPPTGVAPDQVQTAAQIMYYGGMPVEIALIVLVCIEWSRSARLGVPLATTGS